MRRAIEMETKMLLGLVNDWDMMGWEKWEGKEGEEGGQEQLVGREETTVPSIAVSAPSLPDHAGPAVPCAIQALTG